MKKLFIENLKVNDKKVLMRVDFNVPLNGSAHVIDPTRIEAALPSIRYVIDHGGKLILMSHLGRPRHQIQPELSLAPVAQVLSALINKKVSFAKDCIGEEVHHLIKQLKQGEILLLENLRFHRAEEYPDEEPAFAIELASYGDVYINDAFGAAHRKHSSTYSVPLLFPNSAAAGYLMEKEIHFLSEALTKPPRPFFAMLGGAKIFSKMGALQKLLEKVDCLIIGGGMAYTFLKAQNFQIGRSIVDETLIPMAQNLIKKYSNKILLPIDCIAARERSADAIPHTVLLEKGISQEEEGFDIGPATLQKYQSALSKAKTVLWNGPFGVYEIDAFAYGTIALAQYLGRLPAMKIVGGGDLIAALHKAGVADQMSHISTGGGATLEYIEHGSLPGIAALSDSQKL